MNISIRAVRSIEDVRHFQALQGMIWAAPPEDIVPVHVVITVIQNGGGMVAAYDPNGPEETGGMVGLCFWFPGIGVPTTKDTIFTVRSDVIRTKICSHMAGVLPDWQGKGLGLKLKLAQRTAVLDQGMTDWMTWTYDPLFRINAVFNIRRLGAVCNTYKRNVYGVMTDALNAGVPSDRCQVDWWLRSDRVEERLASGGRERSSAVTVTKEPLPDQARALHAHRMATTTSRSGYAAPVDDAPRLDGTPLLVPIPNDIAAIRRADRELGMVWRHFMRHTLEAAFGAGYVVTDCLFLSSAGWHYLLEAQPPESNT